MIVVVGVELRRLLEEDMVAEDVLLARYCCCLAVG